MKRALAVLLLFASPALAQPKPVLLASDAPASSAEAYDLVFVSEGYGPTEEHVFLEDARAASKRVASDPAAAPLRAVRPFNFHYVFVPSNAPAPGDTAFKAHIETSGWLSADDAAADTAAATAAPDVDGVVVLIKFGPGLDQYNVRSNADVIPAHTGRVRLARDAGDALIHELGHTIGGLGDEYTETDGTPPDDERSGIALFANLSLDSTGARWKDIVPTVFEGGGRYTKGVYRSAEHCRMNECRSEDFCKVCQAAIAAPRKAPRPAANLSVANGTATWRPSADPPMAWWYQVERKDGGNFTYTFTLVKKSWLEPQTGSLDLSALPPGDYRIAIWAENMTGSSDLAQTYFTVPKPPSATPGITGGIGH